MATQTARHTIDDSLYIFQQDNSTKWYARFQLFGKWYCKSTKETDPEEAKAKARFLRMDWKIEAETLNKSKRFKDVAEKAIQKMEMAIEQGGGKVVFKDYIGMLNRYHFPFFDRIYITSIDQDQLREFNTWRIGKAGKVFSRSAIQNHNAAMQMVFKEAVENQWMLPIQIPVMSSEDTQGARRASFTPDEYERIVNKLHEMIKNSRKEITSDIRQLLFFYMEFALNTGMRPYTELDYLTWGDIQIESHGHNSRFFVTVRKGKTTKHTGSRQVVCKQGIFDTIMHMTMFRPDRKANSLFFTLPNGQTTKELSRTFSQVLEACDLKDSPHGKRTLYSIRHTYITWELIAQSVTIDVLARQCGTSIQMIEQHYSHVIPRMFSNQLSGIDMPIEQKQIKDRFDVPEKTKEKFAQMAKEREQNYRDRGCI